jgi:hypothetical protein
MNRSAPKPPSGARVIFLGLVVMFASAIIYTTNDDNYAEFYFTVVGMVLGVTLALAGIFVYPGKPLFKFIKALLIIGLAIILSVAGFYIAFSKFYNF